jgi:phage terminase large subunit-like protein
MKKFLRGKRFSSDEEVKDAVTTWFEEQSKDFFFPEGLSRCNKSGRSVLSY